MQTIGDSHVRRGRLTSYYSVVVPQWNKIDYGTLIKPLMASVAIVTQEKKRSRRSLSRKMGDSGQMFFTHKRVARRCEYNDTR